MDEIARANAAISGPLVLATGATATTHLLPPVMADLRTRHPGIDLSVLTGNTIDIIPGLLDGSIDLGLLTAPVRDKHICARASTFATGWCASRRPARRPPPRRSGHVISKAANSSSTTAAARSGAPSTPGWMQPTGERRSAVTSIGSAKPQTAFAARRARLVDRLGGRRARGRRGWTHRPLPARPAAQPRSRPGLARRPRDATGHRRRPRCLLGPRCVAVVHALPAEIGVSGISGISDRARGVGG